MTFRDVTGAPPLPHPSLAPALLLPRWFGVALLVIRLLQTSVLIFIPSADSQAALGGTVCLVSICVQRELHPFRDESDAYVSIVSTWCAFIWMQGLLFLRTGVLKGLPQVLVGLMFVAATCMPLLMVARVLHQIMRDRGDDDQSASQDSLDPQLGLAAAAPGEPPSPLHLVPAPVPVPFLTPTALDTSDIGASDAADASDEKLDEDALAVDALDCCGAIGPDAPVDDDLVV
jgi:hypothetical protein